MEEFRLAVIELAGILFTLWLFLYLPAHALGVFEYAEKKLEKDARLQHRKKIPKPILDELVKTQAEIVEMREKGSNIDFSCMQFTVDGYTGHPLYAYAKLSWFI